MKSISQIISFFIAFHLLVLPLVILAHLITHFVQTGEDTSLGTLVTERHSQECQFCDMYPYELEFWSLEEPLVFFSNFSQPKAWRGNSLIWVAEEYHKLRGPPPTPHLLSQIFIKII